MNNNRKHLSGLRTAIVVVMIVSLLVAAQAVAAAAIPQTGSIRVGPYQVTLLSATFPGDHTSDWTYKIEVVESTQNSVSHTSLGLIDPQCTLLGYASDGTFRVESPAREGAVEVVKWEDITEGLKKAGDSRTFTLTILDAREGDSDPDGTYVAVKYGSNFVDASVEGPICGTTAVSMTSVNATSGTQAPVLLIALALGATVATAEVLHKVGK